MCVYLCSCRLNLNHMLGKSQESAGSVPHPSSLLFIYHSDKERGMCLDCVCLRESVVHSSFVL